MENITLALMELIGNALPELSYIDEDYGQLEEYAEESNPVTFPCVLIDTPDVDWSDLAPGIQNGSVVMSFKLIIDCYDDTHYGSGTEDKIKERADMNQRLYKALQGLSIDADMDSMERIKSKSYTIGGGLKIYESNYRFDYHDGSAQY